MSVSDSGAISGTRPPGSAAGPIITSPDPSPTRTYHGPASPTGPNTRTGGGSGAAATPRAAAAAPPGAVQPVVGPGSKRKSAVSNAADEWAKLTDPRAPPAAVKHQNTLHDHMWWKKSGSEEYQHMAGAEPTAELRRRAVPSIEHHAAGAGIGGAAYEESLRKKSPASGAAATPASPPFGLSWTDRMASAAKRLKQSAADALPNVSPASDIAGDLQHARVQEESAHAHPQSPRVAASEALPVGSATAADTEGTPPAAAAPTVDPNQRAPKFAPAIPPEAQPRPRMADTAPGKSPLQKLREMVMGKAKSSTQPATPASPQTAHRSPRSAMNKPAVSHAAPVMDIGSPLPPYRQTEPYAGQSASASAAKSKADTGGASPPAAPATFWGSVKSLFRRAKSSLPGFHIKPASDIKATTRVGAAVTDRASDK